MRESDPVTKIRGIGEQIRKQLSSMEIETVGDLIRHYPARYETYASPVPIAEVTPGKICAVRGEIISDPVTNRYGGLVRTTVRFRDASGTIRLTWFRMPYIAGSLKKGNVRIARGRVTEGRYGLTMDQPALADDAGYEALMEHLQPVYSLPARISQRSFSKWMRAALDALDLSEDYLPRDIRERYQLAEQNFSIRNIHFPADEKEMLSARRRLVFDEFFQFILRARGMREEREQQGNPYHFQAADWAERLIRSLPYELTGAQKKVWSEIRTDLLGSRLMNRLIQGDVGSGKTVLAALALATAAENGWQSALMVPTEVLAEQHYRTLTRMFESAGIPVRCVLLTGALTAARKRKAQEAAASHEADVIIGTQALIQEKAVYDRLALVITDEQHRFGVQQREALAGKGSGTHILVMSATPIPRTLAIILYGDLDLSVLDEVPANRTPIRSCVVGPDKRRTSWNFIRRQVEAGRQAYIVCPLVEESEGVPAENVKDYSAAFARAFPGIRIGVLHGRMKPMEKNQVMEQFARGEIQVLIATTVIEVGVDVPNATVMMIENAERFGLAQLHQLRGRVGRGQYESYCIFLDGSGDPMKNRRLQILNQTEDGFRIASEDLKMRGPGDIFGVQQSGEFHFQLGDVYTDAPVLEAAAEAADRILAEDPRLESPACRKIGEEIHRKAVWKEPAL